MRYGSTKNMEVKERINPHVRFYGFTASILGIVQGLVWIVLTVMGILIYTKQWAPDFSPSFYGQSLGAAVISSYLNADIILTDVYVGPNEFFIIVLIYIIVSFIWAVISLYLFRAISQDNKKTSNILFKAWAAWTGIICIGDLVVTCFLASDYDYKVGQLNSSALPTVPSNAFFMILANGVLMVISARGFILWILNAVFVCILIKTSTGGSEKVPKHTPIQGYNNPGYKWDEKLEESSYMHNHPPIQNERTEDFHQRFPPPLSTTERLAKIGRKGSPRSPPHNISPPKLPQTYIYPTHAQIPIPSPDYSPPDSPVPQPLKSALKNRTESVYGYPNNNYRY